MKNDINQDSVQLPLGCQWIELPEISDSRGSLSVLEDDCNAVPFPIRRVFWIYGIPQHASRGAHAHWTCHEAIFPVNGAFTLKLDDAHTRCEVKMDSPHKGMLVPAGVWCELCQFTPGTVCVVMASQPYQREGYVNDYQEYISLKK